MFLGQNFCHFLGSFCVAESGKLDHVKRGTPLNYYNAIINRLHSKPSLVQVRDVAPGASFADRVGASVGFLSTMPDVISVSAGDSPRADVDFPVRFVAAEGTEYAADSAVVRDVTKSHFCALLTCDGKQVAFDGGSGPNLLHPFEWKNKLSGDHSWTLPGSNWKYYGATPGDVMWNLGTCYRIVLYYRVK